MATSDFSILDPALRSQLIAIQRTQSAVDVAQLRLASGLKVNSAIENPSNYFAARGLNYRADDLQRLLDTIGQNLQVIKAADNALRAIEAVVTQAEALTNELYLDITKQQQGSLSEIILADNPDGYWRLNDTEGNTAVNLGTAGASLDGTYNVNIVKGGDALYIGKDNDVTADFQGTGNNQFISIPDSALINTTPHAERTVELVFNADGIHGRQVLYEEGGATNAFSIYIDDGNLHVNGRDQGAWGPVDIHAEIEAGETYHVAFTFDFPNRVFKGYLNGEEIGEATVNAIFPNHTADIGIGGMNGDSYYHDGPQNGNGNTFNGRIAEVALYNDVLSAEDIQERFDASYIQKSIDAEDQLNALLRQVDFLAEDAVYKGINLLKGDNMITVFNESRTSSLETEGGFFTGAGLGIDDDADFNLEEDFDETFEEIRAALERIRSFGTSLANDLTVISTRQTFVQGMITTLRGGADDLTLADQNKEGAEMLALQTRQQVQLSVLNFSGNALNIADFLV